MKRILVGLLLAGACWALDLSKVGAPTGGACVIMDKGAYVTCFRADWRIPQWVGEHLTPAQFQAPQVERTGGFRLDPDVPKEAQASLADYRRSGYDIGHQAPAGDYGFSAEAMRSTFVFINAAPQRPGLNRGSWRDLEIAVRALTVDGDVWVFTGPDGPGKTLLNKRVAIAGAFWKVILLERKDGTHTVYAYDLPNSKQPVAYVMYADPLGDIEDVTGLHFFPDLQLTDADRRATNNLPVHPALPADAQQTQAMHTRGKP